MADPKDIITFPGGQQYITTAVAAKLLKLHIRRVRQFIERGTLEAVQLEDGGSFYISLQNFEDFAKKPRKPGRPPTKARAKSTKKAPKKSGKK
jgi:excisionase family DNA binding protein